jgi:hypothetical protein
LMRFALGTSWRALLAVLFFEQAGSIETGVFFLFFLLFFHFLQFIKNLKQFQILNRFQMEQNLKFWTDFKWNNFSSSANGTIFEILNRFSNGTNFQILNIFSNGTNFQILNSFK